MNYYAGIGSRETPKDVLNVFEKVATFLSNKERVDDNTKKD